MNRTAPSSTCQCRGMSPRAPMSATTNGAPRRRSSTKLRGRLLRKPNLKYLSASASDHAPSMNALVVEQDDAASRTGETLLAFQQRRDTRLGVLEIGPEVGLA